MLEAMREFTRARDPDTPDEIWLTEHPPVFTLGLAGRAEHLLAPGSIDVVQTERGGQVTYHGPGQRVVYVMLDLKRRGPDVRAFVHALEDWAIRALNCVGVVAETRPDRIGLWVRRTNQIGRAHV